MIFRQHLDGINRSRLGRREGIGVATVEGYFQRGLEVLVEARRSGYVKTLCDLRNPQDL